MSKIINYISNGKGWGVKYFFAFTMIICFGCWLLLVSFGKNIVQNDPEVIRIIRQMPTLKFKDGKLISPDNIYLFVPFQEGFNSGIVIDTRQDQDLKLNLDSGVYMTKDLMYVRYLAETGLQEQTLNYQELGNTIMDEAYYKKAFDKIVYVGVGLFLGMLTIILWAAYLLLIGISRLFFWILGYKSTTDIIARSATLSWMGVLTLDFALIFFSLQFSIPIALAIALFTTIGLVFYMPKVTHETEVNLSEKSFFDTQGSQQNEEKTTHTKENHVTVKSVKASDRETDSQKKKRSTVSNKKSVKK